MVGCRAHIPASEETGGLQLPGESVEVPFTVLGEIIMLSNHHEWKKYNYYIPQKWPLFLGGQIMEKCNYYMPQK